MPELKHWNTQEVAVEGRKQLKASIRTNSYTLSDLEEAYEELFQWCREENQALTPTNYSPVYFGASGESYMWTQFTLEKTKSPYTRNSSLFRTSVCCYCGKSMRRGEFQCKSCLGLHRCQNCGVGGTTSFREGNLIICSRDSCSKGCTTKECSNRVGRSVGHTKCSSCEPRVACHGCGKTFAPKHTRQHKYKQKIEKTVSLCDPCFTTYVCTICSAYPKTLFPTIYKNKEHKACPTCMDKILLEGQAENQKWDEEDIPVHGSLLIPSSKQRPVRTISVETEFNGNGKQVAKLLYAAGLTASPNLSAYSSQGDSKKYPCFIKTDSSVTGGELITYLLDLDNENHAAALLRMTEVMRGANKASQADFTANAGGHIHIDLHGFDTDSLWSYYTLFMYLQMPLYYIAGAGASYGHRSLEGSRYGAAPTQGPFGSKKVFIQSIFQNNRREGLNLSNYIIGLRNGCGCGAALSGDWQDCDCVINKGTAEWRLWNSTVNPRILHAWTALMQSVTAWAQESKAVESDFPYLLWERSNFNTLSASRTAQIRERLEWMHRNLPLTMPERDSIVYACKKSQLIGLGEQYLNGLLAIPTNSEFALKKGVKNPLSRRKIKFALVREETDQQPDYYDDDDSYDLVDIDEEAM